MYPKVSFIVLSFNYAQYIAKTIDSILKQTMKDFEIIIIDDNSEDNSLEVIKTFNDPRVKLIVSDTNLGGAGSFNKAFQDSRGEFIANVDADDWIQPDKTEKQLLMIQSSSADLVGTFVNYVDELGLPHANSEALEEFATRNADYNLPSTWVVHNSFCRSSTLVRRTLHERLGLMNPELVRAPDYELWLRALAGGQRFAMVPEKLTNYRLHSSGVTHADPIGTYLEFAFILKKHMLPLLDRWSDQNSKVELFNWFMTAPQGLELTPRQRFRVLGYLAYARQDLSYCEFRDWALLDSAAGNEHLEEIGRNVACIARYGAASTQLIQAQRYTAKVEEARDWWHGKSQQLEVLYRESRRRGDALAADLRTAKRDAKRAAQAAKPYQQSGRFSFKDKLRKVLQIMAR